MILEPPIAAILPMFAVVGFCTGITGPSRDMIVRSATLSGVARAASTASSTRRSTWARHHHAGRARGRAEGLSLTPDILVNNAGGPPPGDFRNWTRDDWIKALDANMLTPIELIKATVDGMMARKFGRIVNITSAAVKAPIDISGSPTARAPASPASSPGSRARRRATT